MTEDPSQARTEYLRMRSALFDRITGLPALPLLFDDLRSLLDRRRAIGLLHVGISNLPLAESVYGWQAFDRIVAAQAAGLERMRGDAIPASARFAQIGIHGAEVLAIVPDGAEGRDVESSYLRQIARETEARMQALFSTEEFASVVPRLLSRVGHALLSENPFYRFERVVYRAVDEARSYAQRREERLRRYREEEVQQVIREEGVTVHYQAVIELQTLDVIGYEALSRGPSGSALESPAVMFEVSREAGLLAELDRLCRRLALGGAHGIGPGRKLFLNTRIDHLGDPDWTERGIEETLARLELTPGDLVVEVPEPGASYDSSTMERFVGDLQQRGFRLAIDDIGTGYAGIQLIERLKPDYLKIDTSVVRGIESNFIQQEMLASLVSIARRIGATVIAEGIESEAELAFLRSNGARYGQGFLFSAPVPTIVPGPVILRGKI